MLRVVGGRESCWVENRGGNRVIRIGFGSGRFGSI
ncbi:hypothetical protein V6N12_027234 [Hibiscus sabdariffa]|uniref:Uncharacterized protein n=1 Tax=Hibiscus sabdariffa TaxID=183260 RepID=A0ABR2DU66_9ROSI